MQADRYSRTVSFLKVALPLAALALLSTLFLISRSVTPTATVPFADAEVQERLTNQQVTGPYFSGTSARGDQISFIAEKLTSPTGTLGSNKAEDVVVKVDLASGRQFTLKADLATIDIAKNHSELQGGVEIVTSDGYTLQSEKLWIALTGLDINSPGAVSGTLPLGDVDAGGMRLFVPDDDSDAQLIFTNGVKLLYLPKRKKD